MNAEWAVDHITSQDYTAESIQINAEKLNQDLQKVRIAVLSLDVTCIVKRMFFFHLPFLLAPADTAIKHVCLFVS